MGSSSAPKYDENKAMQSQIAAAQAQAKYGTYGVNSVLGNLRVVQNPDGTTSLSYEPTRADQQRQNLIYQGLGNLSLDPTQAQNAYYEQATRQLLPQFQRNEDRLHEQLINRGITEGSDLYNEQMENLRNQQSGQLADISNQAVYQGQNYLASKIGNIGSLASQYDTLNLPALSGNTGAVFENTYDKKFANDMQRYNQKVAGRTGLASTIGSLAGAAIGGYFGGPAGAAAGMQAGGTTGTGIGQAMSIF